MPEFSKSLLPSLHVAVAEGDRLPGSDCAGFAVAAEEVRNLAQRSEDLHQSAPAVRLGRTAIQA